MYKKNILTLFFVFLFLLSGCAVKQPSEEKNLIIEQQYIKAVFIPYYEMSEFTINSNENEFKNKINKAFKKLEDNGFNRVTVHVRPCADAFYKSTYFPISEYCFGAQGSDLLFDPLEIMIEIAHKHNLSIEAWINPYRVSQSNDYSKLSNTNKAFEWMNTQKVYSGDNGLYFNPADKDVNELIVNGVKEIVSNYAVDSVCFDDYFYPTKAEDIDEGYYDDYKANGGEKSLQDWRRDNVSNMVKAVYSAIKEINPMVSFGISPASNIDNDYSNLYADVEKWSSEEGYIDYICPQIYFGFQNESQPFMKTVKLWCNTASCRLYVALPMYKSSKEDEFAGNGGRLEFVKNNDVVARQITYLSKLDQVKGFYLFSYSSLKDNEETKNLYSAMQKSFE